MRRILIVVLLLLAASPALRAQTGHPQERKGFWFSGGLSAGSAEVNCDACSSDRTTDLSLDLSLGGTVSPKFLVGGEIVGWTHTDGTEDSFIGSFSALLVFYPMAASGLFFKGGLGLSAYETTGSGGTVTADGFAISGGVGYDFRLARNFSLTPYVAGMYGTPGSAQHNGSATGQTIGVNLLQFGLAAVWH